MKIGSKKVKFNYDLEIVRFQGVDVPLKILKAEIERSHKPLMDRYILFRTFDNKTGEIHRRYAWESIYLELKESGKLEQLLNKILKSGKF